MAQGKLSYKDQITFVEPPSHDFKCPICLGILKEPFLTSCCGNHFCKSCIITVKKNSSKCPLCKATPLDGIINKHFKRSLDRLKVYCVHKEMGCKWIGEYGNIEKHLDSDNEKGECQFVTVQCPLSIQCDSIILRKLLTIHCEKTCKYRPFVCKYCGLKSTYSDITTQHNDVCANYPLLCPNHCSRITYPRSQLNHHMAECPEESIPCTFSEMGCKEIVKRRMLQEHLKTSAVMHQMVMCQTITEQSQKLTLQVNTIQNLKEDKRNLESKVDDLLQDQHLMVNTIKALEEDKEKLERNVCHLTKEVHALKNPSSNGNWFSSWKNTVLKMKMTNWPLYLSKMVEVTAVEAIVPLIFKVSLTVTKSVPGRYRSSNHNHYSAPSYLSPPFYSHQNGYKLHLAAEVICHCPSCCKSSVSSTFGDYRSNWYHSERHGHEHNLALYEDYFSVSVELSISRSEHDHQLKWPFKKFITVALLNEKCNDGHTTIRNEYMGKDVGSRLTLRSSSDSKYRQIGRIENTGTKEPNTFALNHILFQLGTFKTEGGNEHQLYDIQETYISTNPNCILFSVKAGYDRDYHYVDRQPPSYGDKDLDSCIGKCNYHFYFEVSM